MVVLATVVEVVVVLVVVVEVLVVVEVDVVVVVVVVSDTLEIAAAVIPPRSTRPTTPAMAPCAHTGSSRNRLQKAVRVPLRP